MPSERFIDALNSQIADEFAAAHQYVAIGVRYEAETFPRLAQFFFDRADEEREHAMKMGATCSTPAPRLGSPRLRGPSQEFSDHVAPIAAALEQERRVSVQIGRLLEPRSATCLLPAPAFATSQRLRGTDT